MLKKSFLNMREAGAYIGQSYRWMQRHYIDLIREGVAAYRVPKDSPKGRIIFSKTSLDMYMERCFMIIPGDDRLTDYPKVDIEER